MNSRTLANKGQSVLNLAKLSLGFEHPLYLMLKTLGAKDIEDEYDGDVEDDEDHEEEEDHEEDF